MASTTITVSNSAQLNAALKNATGGETIVLGAGDYGDLSISNANYSSEVTIVSANPNNMAVFETISINDSSNLTLDAIEVDFNPTVNTYSHESSVMVNRSSDVIIRNSHIEGELATQNGIDSIAGYPMGRGITVQYSEDVSLENNDVSYFHKGVILITSENIDIVDNTIENLRTSHIAGADVHDVNIGGNYLGAVTPYNYGGAGDHGDYIHFWILDGQSQNSSDIVIADNFFAEGEGDRMMGIYLEDHWNTSAKFQDVVIDNNVMHLADHQSIRIEGAQGVDITNNTMLQSSGAPNDAPGVVLTLGVKDVVITDNIFAQPIAELTNDIQIVSESNNIIVQSNNPNGSNYIGNLFVNGAAYNPSLADLQPVVGGLIDNLNTGATLTEAGPDSSNDNSNDNNIPDETPEELPEDTTDETDSDTDSGETDSGGNGGSNGNAGNDNTGSTDPVEINELIRANMNGNANNAADPNSDDETVPNSVSFAQDGNREAAKLNDSVISYDANGQFRNNDAYTLTFDFKKEVGAENASGYAIYYSSSFVVKINADTITAMVQTTNGVNWVTLDDIDIQNSDWHQVTLTFSGETGKAVFYVDGAEAATVSGLEGATQQGNAWHDFFVGGEFGDSFDGLVDNVSFAQGAITAQQAAESYESMVDNTDGSAVDNGEGTDETTDETETDNGETDTGETDIPSLDEQIEIAALDQAAKATGDGILNLGRGEEYFSQDDFTASVTFAMDDLDAGRGRLLWNHMNYGIQVDDDDLVIYFAEDGENMKTFAFSDAIKDTDWHDVQLVLDDQSDTFSIYLDGELLQSESGVTDGVSDAKWWDVTVGGTAFKNNDDFQGRIADFSIVDESLDIDSSMSTYGRTAYVDSYDDMNGSQLDLIGVALTEDSLDFA